MSTRLQTDERDELIQDQCEGICFQAHMKWKLGKFRMNSKWRINYQEVLLSSQSFMRLTDWSH